MRISDWSSDVCSSDRQRPPPAPRKAKLETSGIDMSAEMTSKRRLRSKDWFDNPDHIDMTALYLERFMNYGITPEELRSGRPIIGIAQSGSDLTPCNRVHVERVKRVRAGIRADSGIPSEFPPQTQV